VAVVGDVFAKIVKSFVAVMIDFVSERNLTNIEKCKKIERKGTSIYLRFECRKKKRIN